MYASVARFQRQAKATFSQKEGLEQTTGHTSAKHDGKHGPVNSQFKTSYASVLNGGGGSKAEYNSMEKKTISLSDHEMVQVTDSLEVALVKVKNVDTMSNMYRLCRDMLRFTILEVYGCGCISIMWSLVMLLRTTLI